MSGSSVVDLNRWRARTSAAGSSRVASSDGEVAVGGGDVLALPSAQATLATATVTPDPVPAVGGPRARSVFGPVMAFGLTARRRPQLVRVTSSVVAGPVVAGPVVAGPVVGAPAPPSAPGSRAAPGAPAASGPRVLSEEDFQAVVAAAVGDDAAAASTRVQHPRHRGGGRDARGSSRGPRR